MRGDAWSRFGINWNQRIQVETLSRAAICPFFEEAGSMLYSAGDAWIGRLGAGRIRGKELRSLGYHAIEFAQTGFSRALYWTSDMPIPPDLRDRHDRLGYNLGQYHPKRTYSPKYKYHEDEPLVKNAEASSILVAGAVILIQEQMDMIRKTGDSLHRMGSADSWEDRLETLGEHPVVSMLPTLSDEAVQLLWFRAIALTSQKLCFGLWHSIQMQGSSYRSMSPGKDTWRGQKMHEWIDREVGYKKVASQLYAQFIDSVTDKAEVKESLISVEDEGFLDINSGFHLSDEDEMRRCEAAVEIWLEILHKYFGGVADMAPCQTTPQSLPSSKASK